MIAIVELAKRHSEGNDDDTGTEGGGETIRVRRRSRRRE